MIIREELTSYLRSLFYFPGLTDVGINGLQVEGQSSIKKIATAVSSNLETIELAIQADAQALIVHHGLFWQRDQMDIIGVKRKKIALLLQHNISLFAYHLPLDKHSEIGNNWKAAYELGWVDLQPFGYLNQISIGVKGKISQTSPEALKQILEIYYGHTATCVFGGSDRIETVGLVSGGAHKSLKEAVADGLDAFITGTFDEPTWSEAKEEKINFFALGHSATEKIGPRSLAIHLEKALSIPCCFLDVANPF